MYGDGAHSQYSIMPPVFNEMTQTFYNYFFIKTPWEHTHQQDRNNKYGVSLDIESTTHQNACSQCLFQGWFFVPAPICHYHPTEKDRLWNLFDIEVHICPETR